MQQSEEEHQWAHSYQEPWENTADNTQAEHHQDYILDEHFRLKRQTSVHCDERGKKGDKNIK